MKVYNRKNLRQLRAIQLRFIRNNRKFWPKYRLLVYGLVVTAFLDCISTIHFMLLDGIEGEIHPHIWILSSWFGVIWGPIIGKFLQISLGIPVTIFVIKYAPIILWATIVLYAFAFWQNLNVTDTYHFLF